jgi:hypothetical protein
VGDRRVKLTHDAIPVTAAETPPSDERRPTFEQLIQAFKDAMGHGNYYALVREKPRPPGTDFYYTQGEVRADFGGREYHRPADPANLAIVHIRPARDGKHLWFAVDRRYNPRSNKGIKFNWRSKIIIPPASDIKTWAGDATRAIKYDLPW